MSPTCHQVEVPPPPPYFDDVIYAQPLFRFQITVTVKIVEESICEKTLGIIANNKLSWLHYLHGDYSDPKEPGVGMLFHLCPFLPKDKLEPPVLSY